MPSTTENVHTALEKEKCMKAVAKELESLKQRKVFTVVPRSESDGHEVGRLVVLMTRKRDGTYKFRIGFSGRKQRFKMSEYSRSPTLKHETQFVALALTSEREPEFKSADVSATFLYSELSENVEFFAEILRGHEDYSKKDYPALKIQIIENHTNLT